MKIIWTLIIILAGIATAINAAAGDRVATLGGVAVAVLAITSATVFAKRQDKRLPLSSVNAPRPVISRA